MTLHRISNGNLSDASDVDQFYDWINGGGIVYDVAAILGGPGNTNDATNINTMLTTAAATGGLVYLKPGTWNIGTTLSMTSDNVELWGAGWSTILHANASLNSDIIVASTSTTTARYGIAIRNLFIDGNQNGQSSGNGIHLKGTYNAKIDHVWAKFVHDTGLLIEQGSAGTFAAYTDVNNSLFTDGYLANSVGIWCNTGSEYTYCSKCNFDWHNGNQGKGIRADGGLAHFADCMADANGYNLYISGNVSNKFTRCTFDRAYYKEAWLTGGTKLNKFTDCRFGYYVNSNTLSGTIGTGSPITSIALAQALNQDIPTWGVPVVVSYGTGNADTFTVTGAGAAAGATSIPVNSQTPAHTHAAADLIVLRYRGFDQQGSSGPNYFKGCDFQSGSESLPNQMNFAQVLGEDAGGKSIHTESTFNGGGLALQAATAVRGGSDINGQGVAAISVTASPFTYTNNDNVPEYVTIDGGTVTTVAKNSITLYSFGGAAARCGVWLEPAEAVTVTYTVAPTMNKDRK